MQMKNRHIKLKSMSLKKYKDYVLGLQGLGPTS